MKERLPPLGRRSPSPCHMLCNGGSPDIHAELEKLAIEPAPQWGKTLLGIRHLIREISLAISHKVKASPDSTSLASQIEFPIRTEVSSISLTAREAGAMLRGRPLAAKPRQ